VLHILVMNGRRTSRCSLSKDVGIGSSSQLLDGAPAIFLRILFLVQGLNALKAQSVISKVGGGDPTVLCLTLSKVRQSTVVTSLHSVTSLLIPCV